MNVTAKVPDQRLIRSQHGADVAIRRDASGVRLAQIRDSERGDWRAATYDDLLDFILGVKPEAAP